MLYRTFWLSVAVAMFTICGFLTHGTFNGHGASLFGALTGVAIVLAVLGEA